MTPHAALRASAPTRLDFGGGWTDVPPYAQERGGFVCNLAIERRATVTLHAAAEHTGDAPEPLVQAALQAAQLSGVHATLHSDFPTAAGLGGSSAVGVALAAAVAQWQGRTPSLSEIAEWSRAREVDELGIAGGRQDHYVAAYGGALGLAFGDGVTVSPIPLSDDTHAALEARCLVYYTGESRLSGDTITAVLDDYRSSVPAVVFALDRMSSLARLMATSLAVGDLDSLGALVGEHWVHQRTLHPSIPTDRIDTLISTALAAGALGGKPLGASGGGCVLIVTPADREAAIAEAIGTLGDPLSFRIATTGVSVETLTD